MIIFTSLLNLFSLQPNVRLSISEFISYAHTSVNEVKKKEIKRSSQPFLALLLKSVGFPTPNQVSAKYQQNEKHFNYTTPKSFLEFMKLYGNLLGKKRTELSQKMERLENGLQKLQSTASQVTFNQGQGEIVHFWGFERYFSPGGCTVVQVEDLKAKLAVQEVELWQRNSDIEALIAKIGQQTDKLNQERAVADAEEQKVRADCSLMSQFWPFKNSCCLFFF